ncbi:MAG: (d)CMP kinase [Ignavibacteriales bacterium]|nr:(d)CMP kinase [Ignavibacteriales bacterium]MCF8305159.1 (d)CMP kinase [Ignavibacteriales bacterium]MCF8314928.1 (d)CMP kinase [Ignavibacteriales bacterium]MCF8436123.1 (d)CMP kinase [Ignavibacteriales bacterium]
MPKNIIIAIDGPAGSGKSTVAKLLAQKLGFIYVDTGAMYRAVTYLALQADAKVESEIVKLLKSVELRLLFEDGVIKVLANGDDITDELRSPVINDNVSFVSKIPEVREQLVLLQQNLVKYGSLVAEGRDTTTVVYPDAEIKVYMEASINERARRRYLEFEAKKENISIEQVSKNLSERDRIDSQRKVSPLKIAEDAEIIDTTEFSIDEVVEKLLKKVYDRLKV